MGKKSGYIWIISAVLIFIFIDTYYEIASINIPIWQTEWFMWRVFAIVVVLTGIAFYYYLAASRRRKEQFEDFKQKVIEAQEKEWKMTAGELHDSIGQNLSAINIFLQQSMRAAHPDMTKLQQASDITVETINEVRRISQKLYPKQIERLGLTVAIKAMAERMESAAGIKFTVTSDKIDGVLTHENEVQFYRVVQEILNNTVKHAQAKNVIITIKKSIMFISIEITDDGVGFESTNSSKLGFGLINIEERIRMMKGNYEFISEKGKGTKFIITIPTNKQK